MNDHRQPGTDRSATKQTDLLIQKINHDFYQVKNNQDLIIDRSRINWANGDLSEFAAMINKMHLNLSKYQLELKKIKRRIEDEQQEFKSK